MANLESDMILSVKDTTGCSERAAQTLLKLTGNNVDAAIEYYKSKKSSKRSSVLEMPGMPSRRPTRKASKPSDVSNGLDGLEARNFGSTPGSEARSSIETGREAFSPISPPPVPPKRPVFPLSSSIYQPPSTQNSFVPPQELPLPPVEPQNPLTTQPFQDLVPPYQPPPVRSPNLSQAPLPPQYASNPTTSGIPADTILGKQLQTLQPLTSLQTPSPSNLTNTSWIPITQLDQPTLVLRGDAKQATSTGSYVPGTQTLQPGVNAWTDTTAQKPVSASALNVWDSRMRTRSNSQSSEQPDVFSTPSDRSGKSSRSSTFDPVAEENTKVKEVRPPSYITIEEKNQVEQQEEVPVNGQVLDTIQHWNFQLPRLPAQLVTDLDYLDEEWEFDAYTFACSLQHQVPFDKLKVYLQRCARTLADPTKFQDINTCVGGFPLMFYAVETNNDWLIQELYHYGGDVNAVKEFTDIYSVPLIAFAIINRLNLDKSTTQVVETLLSLGATATVFPKAFYEPLCQDLPTTGPRDDKLIDLVDAAKAWCRPEETRRLLTKALDITLRYYLGKSLIIERPGKRARQVAKRRNGEALFGVPYMMIGQISGASMVTDRLISHLMYQDKKPTVLVFAGISSARISVISTDQL